MQPVNYGSAFTFLAYSHAVDSVPEGEKLHIIELPKGFVLNVPISSLAVTIPKAELTSSGEIAHRLNPRYFLLRNENRPDITVSGWIERTEVFSSAQKIWEDDLAQWQQDGLPTPQNVSIEKIGAWSTVGYDMFLDGVTHSNIRAHWIEADAWVDIHMSLSSDPTKSPKQCRAALMRFLKKIEVEDTANTLGVEIGGRG